MNRTIFALATAPGRAAIAVVRLSGPESRAALATLAGRVPAARRASVSTLRDGAGAVLDQALVLWFPAPGSYTGEDCAEFHLHGGPAVVDSVTRALAAMGLALAEPGEFTRRAFENGRLNLDQAEAVADLIDAESAAQARQALGQLEGALGRRYEAWRAALVEALAFLEAAVDFPDEDVPADIAGQARGSLEGLAADLDAALADESRGQRVREGWRVAIIGAPNAGKSSLINRVVGRDAAIVTPIPGATRDVIEVPLTLGGYRVILADMAGLRQTTDPIEVEGVRRARAWAKDADLRLWMVDQAGSDGAWREAVDLVKSGDLCILNKADLTAGGDGAEARREAEALGLPILSISLLDDNMPALLEILTARVTADLSGADFPAATRLRHETSLREARGHLRRALGSLGQPELAAEDVRLAAQALGRITGRVGAEDILDRVFAAFCIGK